jgi:hypothetical protein
MVALIAALALDMTSIIGASILAGQGTATRKNKAGNMK